MNTEDKNVFSKLEIDEKSLVKGLKIGKEIIVEESGKFTISPQDWRENTKLIFSGILAGSLWITLAGVIGFHIFTVSQLSYKLAELKSAEQDIHIKDAIAANNDAAKTLYAFLTPLAAGITGYFFNVAKSDLGN